MTTWQRRLLVFLGVATFFEGYDMLALAQILPSLRAEMNLDPAARGCSSSRNGPWRRCTRRRNSPPGSVG